MVQRAELDENIQPELLQDGQVCVDMGEPILEGSKVPTTLAPTQGSTVVEQSLQVDGKTYKMTCVGMGNPHAITFSVDDELIKVGQGAAPPCWMPPCALHPHPTYLVATTLAIPAAPNTRRTTPTLSNPKNHLPHGCWLMIKDF